MPAARPGRETAIIRASISSATDRAIRCDHPPSST
jgi:hypothetical protein